MDNQFCGEGFTMDENGGCVPEGEALLQAPEAVGVAGLELVGVGAPSEPLRVYLTVPATTTRTFKGPKGTSSQTQNLAVGSPLPLWAATASKTIVNGKISYYVKFLVTTVLKLFPIAKNVTFSPNHIVWPSSEGAKLVTVTDPSRPAHFSLSGALTPVGGKLFLVQEGESTSSLAARAGVSVEALVEANPQIPRVLFGGRAVFAALREGLELQLP